MPSGQVYWLFFKLIQGLRLDQIQMRFQMPTYKSFKEEDLESSYFSHCLLWDRISSDWRQWHDGEYLSYFHFKISLVFQSKFDLLHTWGAKKSSAFVFMYEIYSLLNNIIHNNILSVGYETSCSNINLYLPIQWQFMTDVFCLWSFKSITLSLIGDIGDLSSKQEQENLHILYENITYLLRLLKSFGLCKLFY